MIRIISRFLGFRTTLINKLVSFSFVESRRMELSSWPIIVFRKNAEKYVLKLKNCMILLALIKGKYWKIQNINKVYNLYIKFEPIKYSNPLINLEIML